MVLGKLAEKRKKVPSSFSVQKDTCLHLSKFKGEKHTLTSIGHSYSMNIKNSQKYMIVKNETELFIFNQPSLI